MKAEKISIMKKSLKINKLSNVGINKKELNKIKGGKNTGCCCACAYEGDGGSSSADNGQANLNGGLVSPQCPDWRK